MEVQKDERMKGDFERINLSIRSSEGKGEGGGRILPSFRPIPPHPSPGKPDTQFTKEENNNQSGLISLTLIVIFPDGLFGFPVFVILNVNE